MTVAQKEDYQRALDEQKKEVQVRLFWKISSILLTNGKNML